MLTGCASWSLDSLKFWDSDDEPTIEEQMDQQFRQVNDLSDQTVVPNASKDQLDVMHNEWVEMKPEIEQLITLKQDLESIASMAQTQNIAPVVTAADMLNKKPTNQVTAAAAPKQEEQAKVETTMAQDIAKLRHEQALLGGAPKPAPLPKPQEEPEMNYKFSIQLAATSTESSARSTWQNQLRKFPEFLQKFEPMINKTMSNNKEFFRLKIGGYDTFTRAQSVCNSFKNIGGQCIIRENKTTKSFGLR